MAEAKAKRKSKTEDGDSADDDAKTAIKFTYSDGKEITLSPDSLTLRERAEVEEYMGMPFGQLYATGWIVSDKASAYLAFMARRRDEEGFQLEQLLDATELRVEWGVPPTTPATNGRKD